MASISTAPVGFAQGVKTSPVVSTVTRLASVDILRGLVMVIMALDHTRDFMTNVSFPPELVSNTYAVLFYTRFITHYCAPVFSFLAGTGAYGSSRGASFPPTAASRSPRPP